MDIATAIVNLMELARRSNMTFGELLEWMGKTDGGSEDDAPWEE